MEIDCGAAVSVISLGTYKTYFKHIQVHRCNNRLVVVSGEQLNIYGKIEVDVMINNTKQQVSLVILDSGIWFVPLIGRNWLDIFYPNWRNSFEANLHVNKLHTNQLTESGFEADLVLKEERPVFRRAYEVPFKLKDKVLEHLDSLEKQNVITPIKAYTQSASESAENCSCSADVHHDTYSNTEDETTKKCE
ncbi:uncharacterized protein LOC134214124 [Armigeres subalbatus]|uniref:uncharacterized protein LOC134214124 n=1 Tax=Armigeres subalbatus TaxID=124917 RepID=UPI002ED5F88D